MLHEQNLFVTVQHHEVPWIGFNRRCEVESLGRDCWQVTLHFGFKNDPDLPKASLGTYNVLWQIAQTKKLAMRYVYLGYWIKESAKMAYKVNFRPIEALRNGQWESF